MSSKIEITYVKEYGLCDRDHFYIVKGIGIVAALIAYYCSAFLKIPHMQHIWLAAAAVFVMCSGYGLSESFMRKGGLVHYWENKMVKVWLPSLAVMVVFSFINRGNAIYFIVESPLGLKSDLLYVIFGGYAAFWVMFQFAEKAWERIVGLFVICAGMFFFVSEEAEVKKLLLAFPVGVMFSQLSWRNKVSKCKWKGKSLISIACAAVAAGAWLLASCFPVPYVETALWSVSYVAMGVLLIFGTYFLKAIPIFGIFVPFGFGSYALYLLYDEVLVLLKGQTDWRAIAIIALLLCLAAALVTALRELLIAWNRKLRRRKRPRLKGSMW